MIWTINVTKPANRDLESLPDSDYERAKAELIKMAEDPWIGDIARLKNQQAGWRRRFGNYRIFYDIYPNRFLIVVSAIKRRTSSTY